MNIKWIIFILFCCGLVGFGLWGESFRVSNSEENKTPPPLASKDSAQQASRNVEQLKEKVPAIESSSIATSNTETTLEDFDELERNWCFRTELSRDDANLVALEIEEWNEAVGRQVFAMNTGGQYSGLSANNEKMLYLEISKDNLLEHIADANDVAMFAALSRVDFSPNERETLSLSLLVKGYTGLAIDYLVIHELIKAKQVYQQNEQQLVTDVKLHLKNAVAYAVYSLNQYDASGFSQMVALMESFPLFKDELNPAIVLTEGELADVFELEEKLRQKLETQRHLEYGLPPVDREFTKIASHVLDQDIGRLYGQNPLTVKLFAEKFDYKMQHLQTNECRAKQSQLFADMR